jgi:SAM-dependent methyltransferase
VDTSLVEDLACPECSGDLVLDAGASVAGDVDSAELTCRSCGSWFPVRDGIPRLLPRYVTPLQRRTADAFGWQWQHFVEMHALYEKQFLDWIAPLGPEDFHGRLVLDAGCGMGRHSYYAARYGADSVVAMDLSDAVLTAREVLSDLPNAHVVQGDILHPPLPPEGFDLIYSIGVIHHLPVPREAFFALTRLLRPGGTIAIWVYGFENNGVVRNVVEPLRRLTTRMRPTSLRAVAWPLAAALHGVVKGVYGPLRATRAEAKLPMHAYLASLSDFRFRQNYNIVFDQLVAPSAAYIRGEELRLWFEEAGLERVVLSHRHGNSWRAQGRRPKT